MREVRARDTEVASPRDTLFVMYAEEDRKHCEQVVRYCRDTAEKYGLEIWYSKDRSVGIQAGNDWDVTITGRLQRTAFALLILSMDALESSYIWEHEYPTLRNAGVPICPIAVGEIPPAAREKRLGNLQDLVDPVPALGDCGAPRSKKYQAKLTQIYESLERALQARVEANLGAVHGSARNDSEEHPLPRLPPPVFGQQATPTWVAISCAAHMWILFGEGDALKRRDVQDGSTIAVDRFDGPLRDVAITNDGSALVVIADRNLAVYEIGERGEIAPWKARFEIEGVDGVMAARRGGNAIEVLVRRSSETEKMRLDPGGHHCTLDPNLRSVAAAGWSGGFSTVTNDGRLISLPNGLAVTNLEHTWRYLDVDIADLSAEGTVVGAIASDEHGHSMLRVIGSTLRGVLGGQLADSACQVAVARPVDFRTPPLFVLAQDASELRAWRVADLKRLPAGLA